MNELTEEAKARLRGEATTRRIETSVTNIYPTPLDNGSTLGHNANTPAQEYTGGSVSYYKVPINNVTTKDNKPYLAECNDIIEALQMNYAEGNAFKAIWRRCAARLGLSKKGYTDGLYDAEKIEFFGARLVAQEKASSAVVAVPTSDTK